MNCWTRLPTALVFGFFFVLLATATGSVAVAQVSIPIDIEKAPFEYVDTEDDNRVTRLIEKLQSKEVTLDYSREHGYLRSMLAALEIPESSQTLVFSKTSLQVSYISPRGREM